MKRKVIGILFFILMTLCLTGCGREKTKTLICKADTNQSGMVIQMTTKGEFGSKSGRLKDYKLDYFYDYTEFFKQSGVIINDEMAQQMKDSIKEQLESELNKVKGLTVGEITNDGNKFYGNIKADMEVLEKEYPDNFKKDGEFTYEGFKKKYTDEGLTCE